MKRYLKILIIELFIFTLIFLVSETMFRAYIYSPQNLNTWGYYNEGYGDLLPSKDFISNENPLLPYHVHTNSYGLRNNTDINLEKSSDIKRILIVGDSFAFGTYVNNEYTLSSKLQDYLKDLPFKTEVLNAGIPGYTLIDEIEYLKDKGLFLKPDLVIIVFFKNDLTDYSQSQRQIFSRKVHKRKSNNILLTLAKKSAVISYFEKLFSAKQVNQRRLAGINQNIEDGKDYGNYYDDLDKLIKLLSENNIKGLFILFPDYNELNENEFDYKIKLNQKLNGHIPVLDLYDSFKKYLNRESLYLLPVNSHPSSLGYDLAASLISEEIKKLNLLNVN